jgi:hypothetical protein
MLPHTFILTRWVIANDAGLVLYVGFCPCTGGNMTPILTSPTPEQRCTVCGQMHNDLSPLWSYRDGIWTELPSERALPAS